MSVWEITQKYDGIKNLETMICDAFPFKEPDDITEYAEFYINCPTNTYYETSLLTDSVNFLVKMTAYIEFMRMQKRNTDKKEQLCL